MKFIDLFSGIGGFRLGMEAHGHTCVFSSEIDKYASGVYEYRFKEKPAGDIRQIQPGDIPDFDILCGGFPCQPFSVSGKRKGFADTRGTLFFEVERILRSKRPQYVFLENVPGILNHESGKDKTFEVILLSLQKLGYAVQWGIVNSAYYLAQKRERVFIIGCLGGFPSRQIFPIRESNEDFIKSSRIEASKSTSAALTTQGQHNCRGTFITRTRSDRPYAVADHIPCLRGSDKDQIRILYKDGRIKNKDIASTLTGGGHSGGNHSDMDLIEITKNASDAQRIYDPAGIARTLKGNSGGQG